MARMSSHVIILGWIRIECHSSIDWSIPRPRSVRIPIYLLLYLYGCSFDFIASALNCEFFLIICVNKLLRKPKSNVIFFFKSCKSVLYHCRKIRRVVITNCEELSALKVFYREQSCDSLRHIITLEFLIIHDCLTINLIAYALVVIGKSSTLYSNFYVVSQFRTMTHI